MLSTHIEGIVFLFFDKNTMLISCYPFFELMQLILKISLATIGACVFGRMTSVVRLFYLSVARAADKNDEQNVFL